MKSDWQRCLDWIIGKRCSSTRLESKLNGPTAPVFFTVLPTSSQGIEREIESVFHFFFFNGWSRYVH